MKSFEMDRIIKLVKEPKNEYDPELMLLGTMSKGN